MPDGIKNGLHPRNKNNSRYDFESLTQLFPQLLKYVFINKVGHRTIDFSNPDAVKTLNRVLLQHHYGLSSWDIPKDYLTPPIPGRADYIHYVADLLAINNKGIIPRGKFITGLDVGVGANCIYPILGNKEYGWHFIGSEIDPLAVDSALKNVELNHFPSGSIEIRKQKDPDTIFQNIVTPDDFFDFTICNPPFHSSIQQADAGNRRKWKNLGIKKDKSIHLNFGGKHHELQFPGGELAFILKMIHESTEFQKNVYWFSSLISRKTIIPKLVPELERSKVFDMKIIDMNQGQKKSRFVAWTFLSISEQKQWISQRWHNSTKNINLL